MDTNAITERFYSELSELTEKEKNEVLIKLVSMVRTNRIGKLSRFMCQNKTDQVNAMVEVQNELSEFIN